MGEVSCLVESLVVEDKFYFFCYSFILVMESRFFLVKIKVYCRNIWVEFWWFIDKEFGNGVDFICECYSWLDYMFLFL